MALGSCRIPLRAIRNRPAAAERWSFAAVVWELEDKTEDFTLRRSALDGAPETNLARVGSAWRPALSMGALSGALAEELKARVAQDAWVDSDRLRTHATFEALARGARVFVGGEVAEATWLRGGADGGKYRLRLRLYAVLGRRNGEDLRFWEKELAEDVPHKGMANVELGEAVRRMFGGAVEEMGKAMKKGDVALMLAQPEGAAAEERPDK